MNGIWSFCVFWASSALSNLDPQSRLGTSFGSPIEVGDKFDCWVSLRSTQSTPSDCMLDAFFCGLRLSSTSIGERYAMPDITDKTRQIQNTINRLTSFSVIIYPPLNLLPRGDFLYSPLWRGQG